MITDPLPQFSFSPPNAITLASSASWFFNFVTSSSSVKTPDFKQPRMKSLLEKLWDILKQQGRP